MTIGEALATGRKRLADKGDEGRFDALRLLEECLERNAAWIVAHRDDDVDAAAYARYVSAVERRARGEPVAYIAGSAGFYGRSFAVGPDVLVPRPETEHVVALALAALAERRAVAPEPRVCDVGTGSGILAITLASEWPTANVTAIDISERALALAARNARALGVEERVRFVRGDLLAAVAAAERFDCIVANLPYVRTGDLRSHPDPTAFEPTLALDGGDDGLAVYRRLVPAIAAHLAAGGTALLEAGPDTTQALAELALEALADAHVTVHVDYGGRERVIDIRRGSEPRSEKTVDP